MKFSISSLVSAIDPYQPSSFAVGLDMGVSGWYQGRYGKCHVIISEYWICKMLYYQIWLNLIVSFKPNIECVISIVNCFDNQLATHIVDSIK